MSREAIRWTSQQTRALAFECNQCLLAGAGSGKTMTLVELMIRLLSGRVPGFDDQLELQQILALTYTEKAAREMRDRLRLALNEEILRSDPDRREFWIRQRRALDRAQITTIHSFCLHVLKQFGAEEDVDPDFSVLDENRDFARDICRETMLDWLQRGDPDLLELLRYFPWINGDYGRGIDTLLMKIISHARTVGRSVRAAPAGSSPPLSEHFRTLLAAADLVDQLDRSDALNRSKAYYHQVKGFAGVVREVIVPGRSEDDILAEIPRMEAFVTGHWQKAKPARDMASEALAVLSAEWDRRLTGPLAASLESLARNLDQAMTEAKAKRQWLDFDDLLLKTRDLLAAGPTVRNALKKRFRVMLVDEFQDTNRLQADILGYLLESEDQAVVLSPEESPLDRLSRAPRRLVIFGDPKQSIYRFRGADVSVFQHLKDSLTDGEPGGVISLDRNFRSQKKLVEFFNLFFPEVMPGGPDYAAEYGRHDHQTEVRANLNDAPGVELLEHEPGTSEAENRQRDAQTIAAYLQDMFAGRTPAATDSGRIPRPQDVVLLLRRFTHVGLYEKALRRAGLPFYTVRGRGFYQVPEVWALINLLFYLSNPNEGPALLGLLRSPLIGLDDDAITRLVWPRTTGGRISLSDYFHSEAPPWPEGLRPEQVELLEQARRVLTALGAEAGRAFPAELVEAAVERTDYLAVLAAQPQGDQKVANVQKFIEMTREIPLESVFAPGEMARFLKRRLEDARDDPEAQVTTEGLDAIQIMTIHQAKGLEFPIVIVPDAGHRPRDRHDPVLIGHNNQFSLTFKDPDADRQRRSSDYLELRDEETARNRAEHVRLLYVAATRAQDHLIFSGCQTKEGETESWLSWLKSFSPKHPHLIRSLPAAGPEVSLIPSGGSDHLMEAVLPEHVRPGEKARALLSRVLDRRPPLTGNVKLDVTGLSQYLICPRQYHWEQVIGMPPKEPARRDREGQGDASGLDARLKGTLLHHLLETVDLHHLPDMRALVASATAKARSEGWPENPDELKCVAALALGFLDSPQGRDLIRSRHGLVQRELPIWLRIAAARTDEPDLILTGKIDLVYVSPDGLARLVDYKYAPDVKVGRYETQLKTYALALTRAGLSRRLEIGLYFTHETGSQWVEIPLAAGWMDEFEARLRQTAQEIAATGRTDAPAPPAPANCPDAGCAYRYLCE